MAGGGGRGAGPGNRTTSGVNLPPRDAAGSVNPGVGPTPGTRRGGEPRVRTDPPPCAGYSTSHIGWGRKNTVGGPRASEENVSIRFRHEKVTREKLSSARAFSPLPEYTRGGPTAMDDVMTGWASTVSDGDSLQLATLLAVGASDPTDASGLDEAAFQTQLDPTGQMVTQALLDGGACSAVEDVEDFYAVGLPKGLPGGLAFLALDHREELLQRCRVVQAARALAACAGPPRKQQGGMRKLGVYDGPRGKSSPEEQQEQQEPQEPQVPQVPQERQPGDLGEEEQTHARGDEPQEHAADEEVHALDSADDDDEQALDDDQGACGGVGDGDAVYNARGRKVATSAQRLAFDTAAAQLIGWLFEHGVSDETAIGAAGVSRNFLNERHKATGTSRAEILRDRAVAGGKRSARRPPRRSRITRSAAPRGRLPACPPRAARETSTVGCEKKSSHLSL